jgi:hypothetical protein
MPADPASLAALLALVSAYVLEEEGKKPGWPDPVAEQGLDDRRLYELAQGDGDVLQGMDFADAVARDPRRIEALLMQRVVIELYGALDQMRGRSQELVVHDMALRNAAIREACNGSVPLGAIVEDWRGRWEWYQKLFAVLLQSRRFGRLEDPFFAAVVTNRAAIARAFRESAEIARRAALAAPDETQEGGWSEIGATIDNMKLTMDNALAQIGAPALAGGGEGYGYSVEDWTSSQGSGGHRAPGMMIDQWWRSGGRWP